MSRGKVLVIAAIISLAIMTTYLSIQVWQLQESLARMESTLYKQQELIDREHNEHLKERIEFQKQFLEVRRELQKTNGDVVKLTSQYDILYKMVLRNKEEARAQVREVVSLQSGLINNVMAIKEEYESNITRIDEKMDENLKRINDSMVGLAELFVNENTECKNETWLISERVKKLESRPPVMIENKVHVEREYHMAKFEEPQLTLGERIGQFVGGVLQDGTTFLLSKALKIIGL